MPIEDELWLVLGIIVLIIIIIGLYLIFTRTDIIQFLLNLKIPKPWKTS